MSDGRSVGVAVESQREVRGDGQWHLATAVMDGATARLYLDGQLQGTADIARLGEMRASNSVRLGKIDAFVNSVRSGQQQADYEALAQKLSNGR